MTNIQIYTGGIAETNSHLFTLPGGTLLVDAPEGVAEWLRERKIHVDVLFLTHQHFDHVMDVAALKAAHGCRVVAWEPFSPQLTLEGLFNAFMGTQINVPAYEVDEILSSKSLVTACGVDWRLYHVPGHSLDSVCFHWEAEKLLFGGDVLFAGSVGRTDLPGGSTSRLIRGIQEKLLPLADDTRVFPGHGGDTTIGAERVSNPYLV
ncbi:MAG: MBL fold metallo-hydrolase [Verrucomicrobiaceae bacterium]|nr:MBL fold metallo-hydrolase [Verrucomicrobiaceae bacterium]